MICPHLFFCGAYAMIWKRIHARGWFDVMTRKEAADAREKATGMRQSNGAMIAKIVIGALFLVSAITTDWHAESIADPVGPMVFSIIIGLALIAWAVIPLLMAKKKQEAAAANAEAERKAEEYRRLNEPKRCPACGAATKGICCEYCGSPLK